MKTDHGHSCSPHRAQRSPALPVNGKRVALAALLSAGLLLALPHKASAQSDGVTQTPTTLAGGKVITADEARKLIDQKAVAMVIDTRSPVNFGKSHLPTAVSIAYKENSDKTANFNGSMDQFDLTRLPADKNANVIIYSDGPMGWKSYKGAVLAIKGGYRNVMYLRGGWSEWAAKGFPAAK